jgi:hypothetical protein
VPDREDDWMRIWGHDHPAVNVAKRGTPALGGPKRRSAKIGALKNMVPTGEHILLHDLGHIREATGNGHGGAIKVYDSEHSGGPLGFLTASDRCPGLMFVASRAVITPFSTVEQWPGTPMVAGDM